MSKNSDRENLYSLATYGKGDDSLERLTLMGSLSTMIIHDIASPLSIINAEIREIKTSGTLPPFNLHSVEVIHTQYDFIVDLISQFRRILSPKGSRTPTCINSLFRTRVFMMYLDRILQNDITLELQLHPGTLKVKITEMEFYQIVFNLISNSVDAINRKREINRDNAIKSNSARKIFIGTTLSETKTKKKAGHQVEIKIIDNGTGLHNSVKDKIFDPFVTTKRKDGFGVGLSIAKNITTSLNGTLEARSLKPIPREKETPPNWNTKESGVQSGSIFKVRLPAEIVYQ